ncbi:MAG: hypothetical protein JWO94_2063 [Verrucomicrobiaceae bacterium]|nr:hypothetical protein [Verrucomicrobiaceae bacterium]
MTSINLITLDQGVCLRPSRAITSAAFSRFVRVACLFAGLPFISLHAETQNEAEKVPFIEQTLDRSTEFYGNGMKSLVDDVLKISGAPETKKAELLKAADEAVKDKMAKSKTGLWKTWKEMSKEGQVDQVQFWNAYRKLPEAVLTPDRSPLWAETLPHILTPDEMTKWATEEKGRRGRIEKAIQDYLKRGRDDWKAKRIEARKSEIDEMELQSFIPGSTAAALKNAVPAAVEMAGGSWGKGLEKQIRESLKSAFLGGAEDRIQALEAGQMNFGLVSDADGMQAEADTWRTLLRQTLEAGAFGTWEAREQKRADRRVQALSMMTVAELDRKLRLTPAQREKLEPVVSRIVRASKAKLDVFLGQTYANTELLMMVINGIPDREASSLIEPDQMAGWREVREHYAGWWNQYQ